jgi:hypothetical protein
MHIYERSKKVLAPLPKTSKTADMETKGDIPMAQIYDEVKVKAVPPPPLLYDKGLNDSRPHYNLCILP